ncbi:PulJ/GspJ family protein [Loktanella sp. Alg231-35]|uniref:PulJ/GspJ family protein n=1 Tax=Loktanella sp. Alg231-35 TaxID=1922220 RepID=UPI00131F43BA|nr:hypothetical protein [Loktanella sp. Alg231-35]
MIRRRRYRHRSQRGFVLAEALVALTVAALTLALMTSATWGLRQTAMQPNPLQQEATDWLTARRVLQAWAGSATTDGYEAVVGRFVGTPTQMRLVVDDGTIRTDRPVMISLDIIRDEDGLYRLDAARHFDIRDVRLVDETARPSTVIITDVPLRFVYFFAKANSFNGGEWTYEPQPEQGLPSAVALERGADRMIVAKMPATHSASCVSRTGIVGLDNDDCELR